MLDIDVLRTDYLDGEPDGAEDDRLTRALASSVSRCAGFTRRQVRALVGTGQDPDVVAVERRASAGRVVLPDCREVQSVVILDGERAGPVDPARWELSTLRPSPTAIGLQLLDPIADRPRVVVTGRFGLQPLLVGDELADLTDSLYVYAAARLRDRDAMYSGVVELQDGSHVDMSRQLPTQVKGVWQAYRIPESPITSVQVTRP